MTLDDIAEQIGTVSEEQSETDSDRLHEDSPSEDLQQRSMEEYDGGWSTEG